jgi:hypothetical protein
MVPLQRFGCEQTPEVGAKVELFGWDKWNTHVLEVWNSRSYNPRQLSAIERNPLGPLMIP